MDRRAEGVNVIKAYGCYDTDEGVHDVSGV